ncbi:helix-turn-helix domain-containing protein [Spirosoma areae]
MEQPVEPVAIELDPMTVRLLEFIQKKDGPSKVAKRIGIKPSVFYNYEAGRNKQPAPDILQRMAVHYPDFDPMYILTGQQTQSVTVTGGNGRQEVLATENAGLRKEIERLEETVSILRTVVSSQLGKDIEGKNRSATETTQGEQLYLDLAFAKQAERRMIPVDIRNAFGISQTWPTKRN